MKRALALVLLVGCSSSPAGQDAGDASAAESGAPTNGISFQVSSKNATRSDTATAHCAYFKSLQQLTLGTSVGRDVDISIGNVSGYGPFSRTDDGKKVAVFSASFKAGTAGEYIYETSVIPSATSACVTDVTEFSSTLVRATVTCEQLIPSLLSRDAKEMPAVTASGSLSIECAVTEY